jgi:hypothetical protein
MRKTLEERFWEKVDKRGDDECWEWQAGTRGATVQYGSFYIDGVTFNAHRVAFLLTYGDPEGMQVCHTCDNGLCCNPKHLFLGTAVDNNRDARAKGRAKNETWKITKDICWDVLSLRYDDHLSLKTIAPRFGLTAAYVSMLCAGKRRPDVYQEFMALRQAKAA